MDAARRRLRRSRRRSPPADRWRAAAAARPAGPGRLDWRPARRSRSRAHHQRHPAGGTRQALARGRPRAASPSASIRCSRDRFAALTRFDAHRRGHGRHRRGRAQAFGTLKIDTVVMRGVNDDELVATDRLRPAHAAPRSGSSSTWTSAARRAGRRPRWSRAPRSSRASARRYGAIEPVVEDELRARGPLPAAGRHGLRDHLVDDRSRSAALRPRRLTADGHLVLCLYATAGLDLRGPLRQGATDARHPRSCTAYWTERTDRGAEETAGAARSRRVHPAGALRARRASRDAHPGRMTVAAYRRFRPGQWS